ncbi:hypothetical protein D3C85_1528040 [compost metagenome]
MAKHFGLPNEIAKEFTTYAEERLNSLTGIFQQGKDEYFVNLNKEGISLGQVIVQNDGFRNRRRR